LFSNNWSAKKMWNTFRLVVAAGAEVIAWKLQTEHS
jgi:hypothetical protein